MVPYFSAHDTPLKLCLRNFWIIWSCSKCRDSWWFRTGFEIVKIVVFSCTIQNTISYPVLGLSFTFRHCCFVEYEQTADAAKALKVGPFPF